MVTGAIPQGDEALLHDLSHDTVGCMSRLYREYGPLVAFAKGSDQTIFAFGPEANRDVFSDPAVFQVYGPPGPKNSAQRRFALGLFGLNGPKQQQHRRLLMPEMTRSAAEAFLGPMREIIDETLAGWRPGQQIDLQGAMRGIGLRIAARLLFGLTDLSCATEAAAAFQEWLDDHVRVYFAQSLPLAISTRQYQDWLAAGDRFEAILRRLIRQRQESLADGQHDFMARLLRAHQNGEITEAEVVGEVHTLLNASYQTTGAGLTWTMLLLAQHPDIAANVLHDKAEEPGPSLLERVVKESLRVLPPVVFAIRRTVCAATLAGYCVPEGTVVIVSQYVTHHMPDLFPEPERFDPDRWLVQKPSPYAYLPFAAGARMCAGVTFSMQLFQLVVPAILRRFWPEFAYGTHVDRHSSLTMGVKGELPVTLQRRGRFPAVPLTGDIHEMVQLPRLGEATGQPAAQAA